jgi:hypothetical protein
MDIMNNASESLWPVERRPQNRSATDCRRRVDRHREFGGLPGGPEYVARDDHGERAVGNDRRARDDDVDDQGDY